MPIFIYNSLSRKKEEFLPLNRPKVNIYTCGVTVYDDSHIGHARSLYIFDVIRRYLKYRGFEVKFVRNITDLDDKIINRANELKVGWQELVEKYIGRYYEDLKALGIEKGDFEPRATENIADMVRYIQRLIDRGYAYEAGGDVYFNLRKFPGYGKLSGQSIDQMETGVRIGPPELKHDPLDFALWKKSKTGEPFWDSHWSQGRPGWHIECSVMSQKFLKTDTLDIHAGGRDLIFPHHENEIAQAEACTGKQFAKYWVHHGLLTINGQKMSKSLGNFVTISDFIAKYKNADLLKMFFLSAHYSHPIDYTEEKIEEAKKALERIMILLEKIGSKAAGAPEHRAGDHNPEELEEIRDKFIKAMDDDFNTPQAIAAAFDLINLTNKNMDNSDFISNAKSLLLELSDIFGLELDESMESSSSSSSSSAFDHIKILIIKRNEARKRGDFQEADKIRKELEEKGVILEDTKDGTTWRSKV